jgi:hypothetical protein
MVPNGPGFSAIIPSGPSLATADIPVLVDNLTLNGYATINQSLTVLGGTFSVGSSGGLNIPVFSASLNLSGPASFINNDGIGVFGGSINLGNQVIGVNNGFISLAGDAAITGGASFTNTGLIEAYGTVFLGGFVNSGTIIGRAPFLQLGGVTNTGTIQDVNGGSINNTGGLVKFDVGMGGITFDGGVTGGLVTNTGTLNIIGPGIIPGFATFNSTFNNSGGIFTDGSVTFAGVLNNTGLIEALLPDHGRVDLGLAGLDKLNQQWGDCAQRRRYAIGQPQCRQYNSYRRRSHWHRRFRL